MCLLYICTMNISARLLDPVVLNMIRELTKGTERYGHLGVVSPFLLKGTVSYEIY